MGEFTHMTVKYITGTPVLRFTMPCGMYEMEIAKLAEKATAFSDHVIQWLFARGVKTDDASDKHPIVTRPTLVNAHGYYMIMDVRVASDTDNLMAANTYVKRHMDERKAARDALKRR